MASSLDGMGGWLSRGEEKGRADHDDRWSAWDLARAMDRGETIESMKVRRAESQAWFAAFRARVAQTMGPV